MNFGILVTFDARCQASYTIRTFNSLRFGIFSGFLNEWLIFYDEFCGGPSDLLKYALTAVRGKSNHTDILQPYVALFALV